MVAIHMLFGFIFMFTGFQAKLTSLANSVTLLLFPRILNALSLLASTVKALEHPSLIGQI